MRARLVLALTRATSDDRATMMRTMLRERFGLAARLERGSQSTLALLLAWKDGLLGPGLTRIEADCPAQQAADRAAAEAALAAGQPAGSYRMAISQDRFASAAGQERGPDVTGTSRAARQVPEP